MKKQYVGLDVVKICFNSENKIFTSEFPGYSGCDSIVGYHNAGMQCDSPDTEKAVYWTSYGPIGG